MDNKKVSVIIVAGGAGKRMGASLPKQFIKVKGKAILQYTIERIYATLPYSQLIVVLPEEHQRYWTDYCKKHHFLIEHTVANGGVERFFSVKNGLEIATGEIIAIHDGVRPFVSEQTILNTLIDANKTGASIPVMPVNESLRQITKQGSQHADRSTFRMVQTPQCFKAEIINKAYKQGFSHNFTDDASVVEADGVTISLVEGNAENIKITTPDQLKIAELLL